MNRYGVPNEYELLTGLPCSLDPLYNDSDKELVGDRMQVEFEEVFGAFRRKLLDTMDAADDQDEKLDRTITRCTQVSLCTLSSC